MKIKAIWHVYDGYCGGSRPQKMTIHTDDFTGMDKDEIRNLLYEILQDEFVQKIIPNFDDIDKLIEELYDGE